MNTPPKLSFRGGPLISAIPIAFFVLTTFILTVSVGVNVGVMIVIAMLGISLGMLFASQLEDYFEAIIELMANRIICIAIICWLWAGAFSGILADSGLIEALVWLGWKFKFSGHFYILCVFIVSALFALSVGSAIGTVVGFTSVIYPAGVLLGAPPGALMGAIISGAAFGDNLAPISDTTIISAATQETSISGVVHSRLKYSLTAAAIAGLLFFFHRESSDSINKIELDKQMELLSDPSGLPMLIPALIVFTGIVSGLHFFPAIILGIVSLIVLGGITGIFPPGIIFNFSEDGSLGGSMVDGITSILPIALLAMLLVAANGLMERGGFFSKLLDMLERKVIKSVRAAEAMIVVLISLANLCVPGNTTAMITMGPFINKLRKRHGINPNRSANLMDTISCSFPFMLPYSTIIIVAISLQEELLSKYDFIEVQLWPDIWPHVYYGIVLFPLMILAVMTGIGRKKG